MMFEGIIYETMVGRMEYCLLHILCSEVHNGNLSSTFKKIEFIEKTMRILREMCGSNRKYNKQNCTTLKMWLK